MGYISSKLLLLLSLLLLLLLLLLLFLGLGQTTQPCHPTMLSMLLLYECLMEIKFCSTPFNIIQYPSVLRMISLTSIIGRPRRV